MSKKNQRDDSSETFSNKQIEKATQLGSNQQLHNNKTSSTPSRSRSVSRNRMRSRSPEIIRSWKSINPFINFMQDFRQRFPDVRSTNILRLGGEEWRNMSPVQKQPYIEAAKAVRLHRQEKRLKEAKRQKQEKQQREQRYKKQRQKQKQQREQRLQKVGKYVNYLNNQNQKVKTVTESKKADDLHKKQNKQNKVMEKRDSDTDAQHSDTPKSAGSVTSEDLSDVET